MRSMPVWSTELAPGARVTQRNLSWGVEERGRKETRGVQWVRALDALPKDLVSVSSTHMTAQHYQQLQLHGIQHLTASAGLWCTDIQTSKHQRT